MLQFVPLGEFDIEFLDGETVKARSNFGAVMDLEQHYAEVDDAKVPAATVTVHAMWLYLGRPKDSLEEWARTVHDISPVSKNGESGDPSPPAVGGG